MFDALRALTHTGITRLSADDSRHLNITALDDGEEGLQKVLAKYPQLDYSKEKDTFTRTLHGGIERNFGTDPKTVKYIIDLGADVNKADPAYGPMLPLGRACSRARDTAVCEELINAGALLDKRDSAGKVPMQYAMESIHLADEKITLLANRGANVNVTRATAPQTPIRYAATKDNVKLGEVLARKGADIKITDNPGSSGNLALEDAIQNSNFSFVNFLLEKDACEKQGSNQKLNPFLKQAIDSTTVKELSEAEQEKTTEPNSRMAIISALVDKGADLKSLDKETALKFWQSMSGVMNITPKKIAYDIDAAYRKKQALPVSN